jgi:hypothetical protein
MTQKMNLALGVNFDLLGTNLAGIYQKNGNTSEILLMPTVVNSSNAISLEDITKEFASVFKIGGAGKSIENTVNSVQSADKPFDWREIQLQLKSAFLYKKVTSGAEKAPEAASENGSAASTDVAKTDTTDADVTEYAFAISVNLADALPDLGIIKINNLFVGVWNTERTGVLARMGIGDISTMLKQLD